MNIKNIKGYINRIKRPGALEERIKQTEDLLGLMKY